MSEHMEPVTRISTKPMGHALSESPSDPRAWNRSYRRFTESPGSNYVGTTFNYSPDTQLEDRLRRDNLEGNAIILQSLEGWVVQPAIVVPITTLRFPNKDEHLNPGSIDRLVEGYEQDINQVHIYQDAILVGSNVVRALLARGRAEVRVRVRQSYPTEYPGDI